MGSVLEALGYGLVLPALLAAAIVLPVTVGRCSQRLGQVLGAAAVTVGFLTATLTLGLAPLRPDPVQSWHWLPTLAVGAAIIGSIGRSSIARIIAGAALATAVAYLIVPKWDNLLIDRMSLRLLLGCGAFTLTILDRFLPSASERWSALVWIAASASAALVLERGGTAIFAQLAGALAAALAGATIAAHRPGVASGILPIAAVLLTSLLMSGCLHSYTDVPATSYILVAVAPITIALPLRAGRQRMLVQTAIVAVLLGAAVGLAIRAEPIEFSPFPAAQAIDL